MESILTSIKKMLGLTAEQINFDTELIIHINSVLSILTRDLGVGPADGFIIQDELSTWTDFLGENARIHDVKTYVYFKVKLIFDPPLSSTVVKLIEDTIDELEWRLNISVENAAMGAKEE